MRLLVGLHLEQQRVERLAALTKLVLRRGADEDLQLRPNVLDVGGRSESYEALTRKREEGKARQQAKKALAKGGK